MMRRLTPYDTGERAEPRVWGRGRHDDDYGKVDFENDEGTTVATIYLEADPSAEAGYRVCIQSAFHLNITEV